MINFLFILATMFFILKPGQQPAPITNIPLDKDLVPSDSDEVDSDVVTDNDTIDITSNGDFFVGISSGDSAIKKTNQDLGESATSDHKDDVSGNQPPVTSPVPGQSGQGVPPIQPPSQPPTPPSGGDQSGQGVLPIQPPPLPPPGWGTQYMPPPPGYSGNISDMPQILSQGSGKL